MRTWRLAGLSIAALALCGALLTGCDDNNSDNSAGVNEALVGIWRHTEIANGDTLTEESSQLLANGHTNTLWADFSAQQCASFNGTWSASEDSVTTIMTTPLGSDTTTVAFALNGTQLTITHGDGTHTVYTKIQAMPDCSDYGFAAPQEWTGTLSATVGGTATSFNTTLYVERSNGMLGFGGYNGSANLALAVDTDAVGHYTEGAAMGTYLPDINNYTNAYISNTIVLDVITTEANHIVCTFSFESTNMLTQETLSVTGGSADLTLP